MDGLWFIQNPSSIWCLITIALTPSDIITSNTICIDLVVSHVYQEPFLCVRVDLSYFTTSVIAHIFISGFDRVEPIGSNLHVRSDSCQSFIDQIVTTFS